MKQSTLQLLKLTVGFTFIFLAVEWHFCGFGFKNNSALQITVNSILIGIALGSIIVLFHQYLIKKK